MPNSSIATMNEDLFWQIIESLDWSKQGDDEAVMQPAIRQLSQMTLTDLEQFAEILAHKLYQLDTALHGAAFGLGSQTFSVDGFLYIRCAVVANGRQFFQVILQNPHNIPNTIAFESLLYLAEKAYKVMGFTNMWEYDAAISYETFSNKEAWKGIFFPEELPPGHKPAHQCSLNGDCT